MDLAIFDKVASAGSLTAAANELGMSLAVVSKRLGALEQKLGVRLLNRTTRRQSLTQEGTEFHRHCVNILAEVQQTEAAMQDSRTGIGGLLRVTAPRMFGSRYLAPLAVAFQDMHPALRIELLLDDGFVDLVDAGADMALRFGMLPDSGMSARYVAPSERILCAAPAYLERHGIPQVPGDLQRHRCIVYGNRPARHWLFQREGQPVAVDIEAAFLSNDGNAAHAMAVAGAGILFKSWWDVSRELADGKLVRVLGDHAAPTDPLHVVYPHGLQLAPRVRHFADYAIARLRDAWQERT